jgi:hypothetical protein
MSAELLSLADSASLATRRETSDSANDYDYRVGDPVTRFDL